MTVEGEMNSRVEKNQTQKIPQKSFAIWDKMKYSFASSKIGYVDSFADNGYKGG